MHWVSASHRAGARTEVARDWDKASFLPRGWAWGSLEGTSGSSTCSKNLKWLYSLGPDWKRRNLAEDKGKRRSPGRSNPLATGGPRGPGQGPLAPPSQDSVFLFVLSLEVHMSEQTRNRVQRAGHPFHARSHTRKLPAPSPGRVPTTWAGTSPSQVQSHFMNSSSLHRPAPWGLTLQGLSHRTPLSMPGPHLGVTMPGAMGCAFQTQGISPAPPLQLDWSRFPENKPVRGDSDSAFVTVPLLRALESKAGDHPKERC